jgi:hypothetical protein
MGNMEQKCDTMFDIVQNLANEVIQLKTTEPPRNQEFQIGGEHADNVSYQLHELPTVESRGEIDDDSDDNDNDDNDNDDNDNDDNDNDDNDNDDNDSDDNDSDDNDSDDNDSDDNDSDDNDSDEDNIDEDINKMTIPDIRVINMNDEIVIDEIADINEMSEDLGAEIIDETDIGELVELSEITEINVSKLSDEDATIGLDDYEDDFEDDDVEIELTINANGDTVLTKSALRKCKIANLRTMALSKGVTVDDNMKKSDIIELIMSN